MRASRGVAAAVLAGGAAAAAVLVLPAVAAAAMIGSAVAIGAALTAVAIGGRTSAEDAIGAYADAAATAADGARDAGRRHASTLGRLATGVVTLDADGTVTGVNECFLAMVDLPAERVVGTGMSGPAWSASGPADFEEARATVAERGAGGAEWTLERSSGEAFPAGVVMAALPHGGLVLTVSDLGRVRARERALARERDRAAATADLIAEDLDRARHELERAADEAAAAREAAEVAEAAVGSVDTSLLGLVSREMRQPLTSVAGYLQDALDEFELSSEDPAHELLDAATRNAARLESLVDDLVTLSDVGGATPEPVAVELSAIVSEVCADAAGEAQRLGVELVLLLDGSVPVSGDDVTLERAVANLVTNALRFTPAGGRVEVSVAARDGRALVEVADNGLDIAEEDLDDLFQPDRDGPVSSRASLGAGFGLAVVKAVVDRHAGTVAAASGPGGGVTFRIDLPLTDATPARGRAAPLHA